MIKCSATQWLASLSTTDRRCSPSFVHKCLSVKIPWHLLIKTRNQYLQRGSLTSLLGNAFSNTSQLFLEITKFRYSFNLLSIQCMNFHILENDTELASSISSHNPMVSFRHSKNIRQVTAPYHKIQLVV